MSGHTNDVFRCEEIFRGRKQEGSVKAEWSDAIFLSVGVVLQFVFQSAWTSKKEGSHVSISTQSEASNPQNRAAEFKCAFTLIFISPDENLAGVNIQS